MKVALLLLICVHKKQSDPIDKCMRGALINRIGFDLTRSQVGTTNRSKVIRKMVSNENEELECIPYELLAEDLCSPLSEAGSGVKWGSQAMNVTGRPHFSTPRTLEYLQYLHTLERTFYKEQRAVLTSKWLVWPVFSGVGGVWIAAGSRWER